MFTTYCEQSWLEGRRGEGGLVLNPLLQTCARWNGTMSWQRWLNVMLTSASLTMTAPNAGA